MRLRLCDMANVSQAVFLVWRSSSRLSPVAYRCGEDGNLGQENPPIVAETEDFPEEFAVDADMKNSASDVVDESSTLALFGSDVALDESGRL